MLQHQIESQLRVSKQSAWNSTAPYPPPPGGGGEHPHVCDAFPHKLLCTYEVVGQVGGAETIGEQVRRPLLDARQAYLGVTAGTLGRRRDSRRGVTDRARREG